MAKKKKKLCLLFMSKEGSVSSGEHKRIVKQMRDMGYKVAEGTMHKLADVRRDAVIEPLPREF